MGIYIPGVTMPQSCYDNCPCQALHWCNALNADTTDVLMEWRRLDGCPLVPVPDHKGPLVEALEVINTFPEEFIFTNAQAKALTNYIIPADPADKEGEG